MSVAESFHEVSVASINILYAFELLTIYGQIGVNIYLYSALKCPYIIICKYNGTAPLLCIYKIRQWAAFL